MASSLYDGDQFLSDDLSHNDSARPLNVAETVRTPNYVMRLSLIVVAFLAIVIPALLMAPWRQTVYGSGQVIAFNPTQRPQFVTTAVEGIIVKWYVYEGQRVRRGQKLVQLRDNDPDVISRLRREKENIEIEIGATKNRIIEAESRVKAIEDSKNAGLVAADANIEEAEALIRRANEALLAQQFRVDAATIQYERLNKLRKTSAVSSREFELAELELKQAERQVESEKQGVVAANKRLENVQATRKRLEREFDASINSARSELEATKASLQSINARYEIFMTRFARQDNLEVLAPTDGVVFRLLANGEGNQFVRAQERLARIVPDVPPLEKINQQFVPAHDAIAGVALFSAFQYLTSNDVPGIVAELYIDGNDLPLLKQGDRVLLQFEGWPAVQFTNYPNAATGTFEGTVYLVDPTTDEDGKFRVLVEPAPFNPNGTPADPWPNPELLRQGVRAQGWFLLEEVSIGYELWRLLNGFPVARPLDEKSGGGSFFGPVPRRRGK